MSRVLWRVMGTSEDVASDDHALNFGTALVDAENPAITGKTFKGKV
eukprot:gene60711-80958_t